MKGGITCIPTHIHPDYTYCNEITDEMSDMATNNDDWRCELYTDYSDASLFESFIFTFSSFTIYFIVLITFVLFYGIFSIIHDWTLVKNKHNLDILSFFPDHQTWQDFRISYFIWKFASHCFCDCCCCHILWVLIFVWPILIGFALDMLYPHILWPIVAMLRSSHQKHKIHTIRYISAWWVGLSLFIMNSGTTTQIAHISSGFSFDIPSKDTSQCRCFCNYIFPESDYYKLLLTTFTFAALTMNFLYSWTMETFYAKHYLYLIKYSLPIEQAHKINPDNCTGSMMISAEEAGPRNDRNINDNANINIDYKSTEEEKELLVPKNDKEKQYELLEQTLKESGFPARDMHKSLTTGVMRTFIFFVIGVAFIWTISVTLFNTVRNNFYGYPHWQVIVGYIMSGIALFFVALTCAAMYYHFLMLLMPRIGKAMVDYENYDDASHSESDEERETL